MQQQQKCVHTGPYPHAHPKILQADTPVKAPARFFNFWTEFPCAAAKPHLLAVLGHLGAQRLRGGLRACGCLPHRVAQVRVATLRGLEHRTQLCVAP
eukprot:scaffold249014_cov21-Tisochrysis_lutea.AAC.2